MSQGIGDGLLTFFRSQFQNLQVHFVRDFFRMSVPQCVPGHAKHAGREHLFTVAIVGEGARLADQRIDDVPIVDRHQLLAHQPRHGLNVMSLVRDCDLFGTNPQIDQLADQSAGNRIRIGSHIDRAAARNTDSLNDVVGVELLIRQPVQMHQFFVELFATVLIGTLHEVFHKGDVLVTALKAATPPQQQRLFDTILEMAVRRFDVAILVGAACVRAFGFAVVVTHQCGIPLGQFLAAGMIPHRCCQRITAMPLRHTAELPERFLNAGTERFERFGKAQRHAFDIAVRQHAVEERVIESLSGDPHAEIVADREVTRCQSSRMMVLPKENRLSRTMQTPPFRHATLERATCRIGKLTRRTLLQPLEQRLRLQPRFHFQPLLNFVPHVGERILACAICAG